MKDTALYLEADEDITSAIDKLGKAPAGPVQVVVPKRSTMLQSIINLKLLKKAADAGKKDLVLVTSDKIATELAARVGLAVAPSLGAKAVLSDAKAPESASAVEEVIEADDPEPPGPPPGPVVPAAKPKSSKPLLKRLTVSDGPPPAPESETKAPAVVDAPTDEAARPGMRLKTPKIPNFHRMQRRVMWIVGLVVLVLAYLGTMFLITNAKVVLYASGSKVDIDTSFAVDPTLKTTDQPKAVLAGQLVTVNKDLSGSFAPTGKQDAGTKATGTITVYNNYDTNPHGLVAGTRFQAPDGKIFRSTADATVPGATPGTIFPFTPTPGKSSPIPVEADQAGDSYNEAPASYTIPGYSGTMQQQITGQGIQMAGGTTKTITIVAQGDVDNEKAALLAKDKDNATRDLQSRVPSGYVALPASQATATPTVNPSPAVGAAGDTATLSLKVTYTVLAVKQSEYSALVEAQEQKQVGAQNQIYDNGLKNAQVTASDKDSMGRQNFHLTTEAYGGAKLDKAAIAKKLKGQRYGDAASTASGLPGVTRADISIWPGWVSSMPSRTDKISITIQVASEK
ncbi:MAG TPA: hypothetical protein VHQ86_01120 [Candidatus Saccharimonadia bacterium]|jgi:hypothetical protein|nr:hypothetical protein [Candidatus Saccharimonadia bacterium]